MFTVISIIILVLAILLILVVLIQPGKGDMLAGMSGVGGAFTSMLGSRKAMDMLTKITIGFAVAIILLSLANNKFFLKRSAEIAKPATEGMAIPRSVPTAGSPALPTAQPTGK